MPDAPVQTVLGFDFGTRRTGVASGQTLTFTAEPVATLETPNGKPDWNIVGQLIATWKPDALIVGIPYNMDGTEQEMTHSARRFANQLEGRYHLPVHRVDERLSTIDAGHRLRAGTTRAARFTEKIDAAAAAVIVETWLTQQRDTANREQKA